MAIDVKQQQSGSWAVQALERIKRDGLLPSPNNYALLYYYFAGTNPTLKLAVDSLLTEQNGLKQEHCDELFQSHLGIDAEARVLRETNAAIEAEVSRALDAIDRASADTSHYSKSLDSFNGTVAAAPTLDQLREAVTKVMTETRSMAKQNERLSQQLAQTTQQLTELRYSFDQAHKELQVDPLTEVGNRKYFDNELTHATNEARDNGWPLSLLMIDIDYFKKFNDSYGHVIGDQVLRLVARTLVENLKGRDIIARYGGEEFVILLPQTRVDDSKKVADQLRASLGTKQIKKRSTNETLGVITVSIGAVEYCAGEDKESLLTRADNALYEAKNSGRNRVICHHLSPEQMNEIKARGFNLNAPPTA